MALFSPWGNQQFFDDNGNPATGWKIYSYAAGSSTPLATYTTSAGSVAQSNPIILDPLGFPTVGQIWLTSGIAYKLVLTNAAGVVKKTEDNITGVTGTASVSQWQASGLTPTYVSATSFTLAGDQTSDFHLKRRLQSTTTAGTIYSTITATAYTTLTTITVVNDSGVLDSGLSAVNLGLLTAVNPSVPASYAKSGANTDITSITGNAATATNIAGGSGGAIPYQSAAGVTAMLANGTAGQVLQSNGTTLAPSYVTPAAAPQIQTVATPTLAANAMTIPAQAFTLDFRSATLTSGAITTITGTPAALTIPSTATLGTISAVQSSIVDIVINNAGTLERAVINLAGGNDLSETGVISTTAISSAATASNVFYSNTARTNVAYRVVGRYDSTQATAGTWVTAPSLVQGVGGNALEVMSSTGMGQTWQAPARAISTTYYNTTSRPIHVSIGSSSGIISVVTLSIAGGSMAQGYSNSNGNSAIYGVVPPGMSYILNSTSGSPAVAYWNELR